MHAKLPEHQHEHGRRSQAAVHRARVTGHLHTLAHPRPVLHLIVLGQIKSGRGSITLMGRGVAVAAMLSTAACRFAFDPQGAPAPDSGLPDGPPDAAAVSLSCRSLAPTCGPMGNASCCDSLTVPGGVFYRSYDVAVDQWYADQSWPATVTTFRLDTYEVTVGRFRQWVSAGGGTLANPPPAGAGARTLNATANQGGWDSSWNANLEVDTAALMAALHCSAPIETWTDAPGSNESLPINCVTWFEAMAFCAWDEAYLPSEAEWNYAATGGDQQRAYPWSKPAASVAIDCAVTNFGGTNWPSTACVAAGTSRVGSNSPAGDSVWGQSDLGGNVWEWVLDSYAMTYPTPCTDCANLTPGPGRAVRGGSWYDLASGLRTAARIDDPPATRLTNLGMRCARTPIP